MAGIVERVLSKRRWDLPDEGRMSWWLSFQAKIGRKAMGEKERREGKGQKAAVGSGKNRSGHN